MCNLFLQISLKLSTIRVESGYNNAFSIITYLLMGSIIIVFSEPTIHAS
jgi:hypothetical protein